MQVRTSLIGPMALFSLASVSIFGAHVKGRSIIGPEKC
jgi:hypothetical protein